MININMPTTAAIAVIILYDAAAVRLKLSHKNPKTTLATKNVVPATTLYRPYAVPLNSEETYLGITALWTVSEIPMYRPKIAASM